jgi:hypothetical protein
VRSAIDQEPHQSGSAMAVVLRAEAMSIDCIVDRVKEQTNEFTQ